METRFVGRSKAMRRNCFWIPGGIRARAAVVLDRSSLAQHWRSYGSISSAATGAICKQEKWCCRCTHGSFCGGCMPGVPPRGLTGTFDATVGVAPMDDAPSPRYFTEGTIRAVSAVDTTRYPSRYSWSCRLGSFASTLNQSAPTLASA